MRRSSLPTLNIRLRIPSAVTDAAGLRKTELPHPVTAPLPAYSGGTVWDSHPLPRLTGKRRCESRSITETRKSPRTQTSRPCGAASRVSVDGIGCDRIQYLSHPDSNTLTMQDRLASGGLQEVAAKLAQGERLTLEDGEALFACQDLLAVGWLANRERERRHGDRTYFNHNIRLEATNVCVASCLFCSFARLKPGDQGAYTMSLEQVWNKLRERSDQALTEVHVVNGLHPDLPFDYYLEMLRGLKEIRPDIQLKCFTAVEIAFFADLYEKTDEGVLRELMDAGLDSLPGGGAEVFSDRVRQKICHDKCGSDRWLEIHKTAHRLGMKSNVTMLFGHIETARERVVHMLRVRDLQDETAGFQAFIPLAFHPDNNQMKKLPAPTATDSLRVHAVARLMLDNVPHVKAFWIATGLEVAQTSLWFGVDDLDGTVQEERIYHMAGASTPVAMTPHQIGGLIREARREPVERDTFYNVVSPVS